MKLSSLLAWLSLVINILLYWCIINREGVVNFISFKLYKCCRALWDYFYVFHRPDLCNFSTKKKKKKSQYLWNKHSMGNTLYDFYSLCDTYQETHSLVALACSLSYTTQLVNKNRTVAFKMKKSLYTNPNRIFCTSYSVILTRQFSIKECSVVRNEILLIWI